MLGISLDLNKEQWKDAIKRDTLDWEQVCDFDGFNSEVAKQYTIQMCIRDSPYPVRDQIILPFPAYG